MLMKYEDPNKERGRTQTDNWSTERGEEDYRWKTWPDYKKVTG